MLLRSRLIILFPSLIAFVLLWIDFCDTFILCSVFWGRAMSNSWTSTEHKSVDLDVCRNSRPSLHLYLSISEKWWRAELYTRQCILLCCFEQHGYHSCQGNVVSTTNALNPDVPVAFPKQRQYLTHLWENILWQSLCSGYPVMPSSAQDRRYPKTIVFKSVTGNSTSSRSQKTQSTHVKPLVMEQTKAGKGHSHSVFIRGRDDFSVGHAAARSHLQYGKWAVTSCNG